MAAQTLLAESAGFSDNVRARRKSPHNSVRFERIKKLAMVCSY
jgi:hypothetical protein